MPTITLGPSDASIPFVTAAAVCEVKQNWTDDWTVAPELIVSRVCVAAGGHEMDSASVRRRYGAVKQPYASSFAQTGPVDLDRWWLRISLAGGGAVQPIFVGRILVEDLDLYGEATGGPAGWETFQAVGPQVMLHRTAISRSLWVKPASGASSDDNVLDWLPPMNDRLGAQAFVLGNRSRARYTYSSTLKNAGYYCYGDDQLWSGFDYLEYTLATWMDYSADGGPVWTVEDPTGTLASLKICQEWPESTTALHIFQTLVNPELGIDFFVTADDVGFHVKIFSLQSHPVSSGGVTLPANPNLVQVAAAQTPAHISTRIERSSAHVYGKIRVLGKRIVCCTTLAGADLAGSSSGLAAAGGSLVPFWPYPLQTDYESGVGPAPAWTGPADENPYPENSPERADFVRRAHRYRDVYQLYLCPAAFDVHRLGADVGLDNSGQLRIGDGGGNCPPWQARVRKTLHWLPLIANWDYTVDPPVNNNTDTTDPDYRPQFLSPILWLWALDGSGLVPADQAHVSVGVPHFGLGLRIHCRPNHLVENIDDPAWRESGWNKTRVLPKYQMSKSVATVAFELDGRLALEYAVPGMDEKVDGVEEIRVDDAELWILAKDTALTLDADDPTLLAPSGDHPRLLRDDRPRLAMVLAGAIARCASRRARALVTAEGFAPWGGLLGQILTLVSTGSAAERVDAPITRIEWNCEKVPRTILSTGYAGAR